MKPLRIKKPTIDMVMFNRADYSIECALSREEIERIAADTARLVLERVKMAPLRSKRSDRREREWIIELAVTCVGRNKLVAQTMSFPAFFRIPERTIVISRDHLANGDASFSIGHELGHWAWYELLGGRRGTTTAQYVAEERFANEFAYALLGRGCRDMDSGRPASPKRASKVAA